MLLKLSTLNFLKVLEALDKIFNLLNRIFYFKQRHNASVAKIITLP